MIMLNQDGDTETLLIQTLAYILYDYVIHIHYIKREFTSIFEIDYL